MGKTLSGFKSQHFLFHGHLKKAASSIRPLYSDEQDFERLSRELGERTADRQDLLFAERRHGIIVVFQGMDAAGKDGTIKHVFAHLNPLGVESAAFGAPSAEERRRDFLWRTHSRIPARGRIGIFNRSYYEDVLTVRVHPEMLEAQGLPGGSRKDIWKTRFHDIRNFESYLLNQGYLVLKFFLHVSKSEQKKRLLSRIEDHRKNWKFDRSDLEDRKLWPSFMRAYDECLRETHTEQVPWYVIPADDKKNARLITAAIFNAALEALPLKDPEVSPEQRRVLKKLKKSVI